MKKNIVLAYLPVEMAKPGERVELDLIEGRRAAVVTAAALWDPKGERLRA